MNRSARSAVVILGLITALIHLVLLNFLLIRDGLGFSVIFTLNGLGYLTLLALFAANPGFVRPRRRWLHYAFIGYTALTILAWIPAGSRDLVGYAAKFDELLLIAALVASLRGETSG